MVADLPQLNNRIHECSCAASTLEGRDGGGGEGRGRGREGEGIGRGRRGEGKGSEGEGREEIYLRTKNIHTVVGRSAYTYVAGRGISKY